MKTKVNVTLNWRHCFNDENPNTYEAKFGDFTAEVVGKKYSIFHFDREYCSKQFSAKSRSNKDAFERASKKLVSFVCKRV